MIQSRQNHMSIDDLNRWMSDKTQEIGTIENPEQKLIAIKDALLLGLSVWQREVENSSLN